ncbi:MAG: FemAB family XrtA/PEP-CTERM system-associated protein [Pseudomonadota bacterium]
MPTSAAVIPLVVPGPVRIRAWQDSDEAAWDAFVLAHPDGTFFHLSGWKQVIETVHRHRTHFLVAEQNGELCGVLPLAEVRSFLFGASLVSLPFCVYGGPLAVDSEVTEALVNEACSLAEKLSVDHLELRSQQPVPQELPTKDLYVTFRKPVSQDHDENLKAVPRKQRAMIRKGIKAGLEAVEETDTRNLYACYSESQRNLGTPVFTRRHLEALVNAFPKHSQVLTVMHDGQPVSSVLSFFFRDEVLPYYGGGLAAARGCYANDFMYWEVMQRAVERGVAVFDYGRSKEGTGSYRFKKHWGFEPTPLHYQYHLVKATQMPNLSPTNPRYQKAINTWKRLPVAVTNVVGPPLARFLG